MKKILWILILTCLLSQTVSANEVPDLLQSGSICITMRYNGNPVPGGELTLYRVGDIKEENGNFSFVLTEELTDSGISLENVQSPETAKKLSAAVRTHTVSAQKKTIDSKGKVRFDELQPGLYLLVQRKSAKGYYCVNPFLVSLPMLESDAYIYQIDASPKVSPVPEVKPDNPEQPKTGQPGWPIWMFVFSATALTLVLSRKKYV